MFSAITMISPRQFYLRQSIWSNLPRIRTCCGHQSPSLSFFLADVTFLYSILLLPYRKTSRHRTRILFLTSCTDGLDSFRIPSAFLSLRISSVPTGRTYFCLFSNLDTGCHRINHIHTFDHRSVTILVYRRTNNEKKNCKHFAVRGALIASRRVFLHLLLQRVVSKFKERTFRS